LLSVYRQRGYSAVALANHLARLGWTPRGRRRLLSHNDLAECYDPGRLSHRPCTFDRDQLDWFNHRYLSGLDAAGLVSWAAPRWQAAYGISDRAQGTSLSGPAWRRALVEALRDDLHHLDEVPGGVSFAFADEVAPDSEAAALLSNPYAPAVLRAFLDQIDSLPSLDFSSVDAWITGLRWALKEKLRIRSRDVMFVLRAALTGRVHGPCLVAVIEILGRERCTVRARAALVAAPSAELVGKD
jgi:nondiscriminating glutamyl-tRNA synthetase